MEYIIIIPAYRNLVFLYFWQGAGTAEQAIRVLLGRRDHLSDQLDYRFEQERQQEPSAELNLFWR